MSSTRPIVVAGPIDRNSKLRRSGSAEALGGGVRGRPPRPWAQIRTGAKTHTIARERGEIRRRIVFSNGVEVLPMVTRNVTLVTPNRLPSPRTGQLATI